MAFGGAAGIQANVAIERDVVLKLFSSIHQYLLMVMLGGTVFLFGPAAARAAVTMPPASFDCAKAPGVDESVICSDADLRHADYALGEAYRALRAAAPSGAYKASLRNDERSWILQRNAECHVNRTTVVTAANRPGFVDCFLDEYAERIGDLAVMKRHLGQDPETISHPIRRSFLATSGANGAPPSLAFTSVPLPLGNAASPALAWAPDGDLLVLGTGADGNGVLYAWRQAKLQRLATVPDAAGFSAICAAPDGQAVLVPARGDIAGEVTGDEDFKTLPVPQLPESVRAVCGMDNAGMSIGDGEGDTLWLGPAQLGVTPVPRFVTAKNAAGTSEVQPPIRIDSRFHLAAAYQPFADKFVLWANVAPAVLESAVERRWAKRNCLDYWEVSPETGTATPGCIPFGPYVGAVPVVLPTQAGVFLAAGAAGLYRISDGAAQPAMAGDVSNAVVSPSGEAIAFDLAAGPGSVAVTAGTIIVLQLSAAPGTR